MNTIIDTHTHLDELKDPLTVLADCAAAGVSDVVALGVDLASNRKHLDIRLTSDVKRQTTEYPRVHLALGLHPGNITTPKATEECLGFMRDVLAKQGAGSQETRGEGREAREKDAVVSGSGNPDAIAFSSLSSSVVAIGEIGLDYWYKGVRKDDVKKREQRETFDRQLALAREFDLPVVVHSRGAWADCLEMAKNAGVKKANYHWYSGPIDVLQEILSAGYVISVTPALSYSPQAQEAARYAPLGQILVETDTPVAYQQGAGSREPGRLERQQPPLHAPCSELPANNVPRPSTPKDVWRTLKLLADLKGVSEDDALTVVNANAKNFFGI